MSPENYSAAESADLLRKQIGTARTLLLIVAIATLVSAMLLLPSLPRPAILENIILTGMVSVFYFVLAFYTRRKPYTAIRIGLLLLLLAIILDIFWNPFGPFSRWQSKILTLLLLLLGIGDSKDAQRKMNTPPAPPSTP
jgi:CBS domain containing-hemolysin-like protein